MTRARDTANLIGSGNFSSTTFTATAGQTAFTISHTQGFVQVFMNGLLLDETADYTSNGTAITLTSGAAAGDEIEVVKYDTFSVGDAQTQAQADTRYYTQSVADSTFLPTTGGTISGNLATSGTLTSTGLITASGGVAVGGTGAANTLDDYEEGTFTGAIEGYYGNPSTAVTSTGYYTKVGNTISFWVMFENCDTTGGSGHMWMTGLPVASNGPYAVQQVQMSYAGTFGTNSGPFGLVSGTILYFYYHQNQSSTPAVFHNAGTGRYIRCSGTYRVA